MTNDFFGLFGLPVGFDIDKAALKAAFLQLQKQHHPDNSINQATADQQTALINHAYATLNRDDSRAVYLLERHDAGFNPDKSISDKAFLMQMMTYRMDLDDASDDNDTAQLIQIGDDVSRLNHVVADEFFHSYQAQDWQAAQLHAQKLKFLANLHDDVMEKLTQISSTDDDDDLYV